MALSRSTWNELMKMERTTSLLLVYEYYAWEFLDTTAIFPD